MINWLKDPTPAGLFLFLTLLSIAGAIAILVASPVRADEKEKLAEVERIMLTFAENAPRHPAHRAKYRQKLATRIVAAADKYDLEVELVTTVVQRESGFHATVKDGTRGEIGVMQVHPGTAKLFRCDVSTVTGQLDCGCKILRFGIDKCGSVEGALSVYGSRSARCKPKKGSRLDGVVKSRMKLMEKQKGG